MPKSVTDAERLVSLTIMVTEVEKQALQRIADSNTRPRSIEGRIAIQQYIAKDHERDDS